MYGTREDFAEDTLNWYRERCGVNEYLEVRRSKNIANPLGISDGQAGVFAKQDIYPKAWLCPYVGILKGKVPGEPAHRHNPPKGYQSCYKIEAEMNGRVTADAKDLLYDVGYVSTRIPEVDKLPCPPNFARCINSISVDNVSRINGYSLDRGRYDRRFNVNLEFDPCGRMEVWVKSTRYIRAGEEILVDYGGTDASGRVDIFDASLMQCNPELLLLAQAPVVRRHFNRKEAKVGK